MLRKSNLLVLVLSIFLLQGCSLIGRNVPGSSCGGSYVEVFDEKIADKPEPGKEAAPPTRTLFYIYDSAPAEFLKEARCIVADAGKDIKEPVLISFYNKKTKSLLHLVLDPVQNVLISLTLTSTDKEGNKHGELGVFFPLSSALQAFANKGEAKVIQLKGGAGSMSAADFVKLLNVLTNGKLSEAQSRIQPSGQW